MHSFKHRPHPGVDVVTGDALDAVKMLLEYMVGEYGFVNGTICD